MDISTRAVVDTFDIEIKDPATGEALLSDDQKPCTVTVYGPGSKPFAVARSAASNRSMKRIRARGKTDTTPEEDIASTAAFLTAVTVSFNGFDYKGMTPGPDAFRALYSDTAMGWLTEQVNAGAGDWANFTQAA